MKELFNQFMEEFRPWVLADCIESDIFDSGVGMCRNFEKYALKHSKENLDATLNFIKKEVFGGRRFPFNADANDYFIEIKLKNVYKNPKRLAFIQNWEPLK